MRTSMLVTLLVVVLMVVAFPANARQTTVTTTDDIVSVRIAGDVYWADQLVWKFQIFSGPGQQTPVVKLPEGCTVKLRLDAVGTDGDKPIMLAVDKGEGTVPTEARREICYTVGPNDDWIVARTLYKGAVRTDSPLFVFVIGWGSKVDHADRKGAWPFAVESTKVYGIKCWQDAQLAIMKLGCVGHLPTMNLDDIAEEEAGAGATLPTAIPIKVVDPEAYEQFVQCQRDLDANQDVGIGRSLELGNQNSRDIAEIRAQLEQNRRAHEAPPVVQPASVTTAIPADVVPPSLREALTAKYSGQSIAVFGNARLSAQYKYWMRKPRCAWEQFDSCFPVTPVEEATWSSKSNYRKQGYVEFGITLASATCPPSRWYQIDPLRLQVIILDEEAK